MPLPARWEGRRTWCASTWWRPEPPEYGPAGPHLQGHAGIFGGQARIYNGEGLFGVIFDDLVTAWQVWTWRREAPG
jgi:hypothetical protein